MDLIRRFSKEIFFLLLLILVLPKGVESADSQKYSIKIKLRYISKSHGNFDVKKFKLNHPIKISRRDIIHHLYSLKYQENYLGKKEEPAFSKDEINKLVPALKKAFAKVSPAQIIHFELKGKGGVTSGNIFSFRKYLNWRFDSIHGETFFQKHDVRRWDVIAWRLIPQKGQLYFKSGAEKGKRIHKNWVVANMRLPVSKQQIVDEDEPIENFKADNSSKNFNPELEKKLKHLKYLHNKNLLDDEEYKTQRNKLFDELL
jgi:hypothetical protein